MHFVSPALPCRAFFAFQDEYTATDKTLFTRTQRFIDLFKHR
ncbi:hypothetical protein AP060_00752 [Pseudomonas sp. TAD18]|nr:hypothetical protein AP060_00752 [Pseudomonas sp. TAD18]KVV09946.1 hypothetical protein AP059_00681 [Pseudomonas sp. TAA207]